MVLFAVNVRDVASARRVFKEVVCLAVDLGSFRIMLASRWEVTVITSLTTMRKASVGAFAMIGAQKQRPFRPDRSQQAPAVPGLINWCRMDGGFESPHRIEAPSAKGLVSLIHVIHEHALE